MIPHFAPPAGGVFYAAERAGSDGLSASPLEGMTEDGQASEGGETTDAYAGSMGASCAQCGRALSVRIPLEDGDAMSMSRTK